MPFGYPLPWPVAGPPRTPECPTFDDQEITEERLLAEISLATAIADLAFTADRRLFVATGSGLAAFQIHR